MKKEKTILVICPFAKPNLGGVEAHLQKLVRYLNKKNCFVYLLTYQPLTTRIKAPKKEEYPGLVIERVNWFGQGWFHKLEKYFPLSFAYLFPGLFIKSLFFYLKKHGEIDCLHAHGLASAMIVKILARIHSKRTVVSTHAVYSFSSRPLLARIIYWVLADFDQVLAVGEPSRVELIRIGLEAEKTAVHPNWVETDVFKPGKKKFLKKKQGFDDLPMVLFVGRLIKKKGVDLLLRASREFKKINFVFVGSGPFGDDLTRSVKKQKNVFYVGRLSQDKEDEFAKLLELYQAADLFSSLPNYEEGFAGVYLEAISCGTPVLASNKGCLPSFLTDETAVLIEPNLSSLRKTLRELFYKSGRKLAKMTKNSRSFALANFSDKNAEVILKSYE